MVGIWAKNRYEWLTTHLANMYFSYTTIGFFDSMGVDAVDFIMKQTELSCVFCDSSYTAKVIQMRKDGLATTVKHLISFDPVKPGDLEACKSVGI